MNYTEYIKKYQNAPSPIVKVGAKPELSTEEILLKAGLPSTGDPEKDKELARRFQLSNSDKPLELVHPELLFMPTGAMPLTEKVVGYIGSKIVTPVVNHAKGMVKPIAEGVKKTALKVRERVIPQKLIINYSAEQPLSKEGMDLLRNANPYIAPAGEDGVEKMIEFIRSDYNRLRLKSAGYSDNKIDEIVAYEIQNINNMKNTRGVVTVPEAFMTLKYGPDVEAIAGTLADNTQVIIKRPSSTSNHVKHEAAHASTRSGLPTPQEAGLKWLTDKNWITKHNDAVANTTNLTQRITSDPDLYLYVTSNYGEEFAARAKTMLQEMSEHGVSIDDLLEALLNNKLSPQVLAFMKLYGRELNVVDLLTSWQIDDNFFNALKHIWTVTAPVTIGINLTSKNKYGGILNYLEY